MVIIVGHGAISLGSFSMCTVTAVQYCGIEANSKKLCTQSSLLKQSKQLPHSNVQGQLHEAFVEVRLIRSAENVLEGSGRCKKDLGTGSLVAGRRFWKL
jgi:hypothetical protein